MSRVAVITGGASGVGLSIAQHLVRQAKGITVNTIPPFAVDTPLLRAAQDAKQLASSDVVARMIPARRLGSGDDIAAACAFLCSDAASYITGQVIAVNGGAVM